MAPAADLDATLMANLADERSEQTPEQRWDLERLREARRLCDWMHEQYSSHVGGRVVEIGPGIGTFSERLAADPAVLSLLLVEPDRECAARLSCAFGEDARVSVAAETLPDSAALAEISATVDFLLCQNVLEHVTEERQAVRAMAQALRPGGRLTLLTPNHPGLYGSLDRQYGHRRRYTRARLRALIEDAGLEVEELYAFNLLGVPGWWLNCMRRAPRIDRTTLRVYEALLSGWRPIERRHRPRWGLSLVAHARKPFFDLP